MGGTFKRYGPAEDPERGSRNKVQDAATISSNSNQSISESMILDGEQSHVERVGEREGELRQCAGCGNKIHDKYLLQVTFLSAGGNFLVLPLI
jgi:hypothetical protein